MKRKRPKSIRYVDGLDLQISKLRRYGLSARAIKKMLRLPHAPSTILRVAKKTTSNQGITNAMQSELSFEGLCSLAGAISAELPKKLQKPLLLAFQKFWHPAISGSNSSAKSATHQSIHHLFKNSRFEPKLLANALLGLLNQFSNSNRRLLLAEWESNGSRYLIAIAVEEFCFCPVSVVRVPTIHDPVSECEKFHEAIASLVSTWMRHGPAVVLLSGSYLPWRLRCFSRIPSDLYIVPNFNTVFVDDFRRRPILISVHGAIESLALRAKRPSSLPRNHCKKVKREVVEIQLSKKCELSLLTTTNPKLWKGGKFPAYLRKRNSNLFTFSHECDDLNWFRHFANLLAALFVHLEKCRPRFKDQHACERAIMTSVVAFAIIDLYDSVQECPAPRGE